MLCVRAPCCSKIVIVALYPLTIFHAWANARSAGGVFTGFVYEGLAVAAVAGLPMCKADGGEIVPGAMPRAKVTAPVRISLSIVVAASFH
jgi:hypothetical protein